MAVTYTPQTWNDDDPTTPVDSARLGHMESGISAVATEINNHETSVAQQFTALSGTYVSVNQAPLPLSKYATNDSSLATDQTAQVQAWLQAIYVAGGGTGLIDGHYRADGQLTLPNDGATPTPNGKNIRLMGMDPPPNTAGTAPSFSTSLARSILDLRYSGTNPKILALAMCGLELDHFTLTDQGGGSTPFIIFTNAVPRVHDLAIFGTKTALTGDQDVFICGGTQPNPTNDVTGGYQAYGGYFRSNTFQAIRTAVRLRCWANSVYVENNHINSSGDGGAGHAPFEIDPGTVAQAYAYGNHISRNLIEVGHYKYGIKVLNTSQHNVLDSNDYWDATATTLADVYFDATATQNLVMGYGQTNPAVNPHVIDDNGNNLRLDVEGNAPTVMGGLTIGNGTTHGIRMQNSSGTGQIMLTRNGDTVYLGDQQGAVSALGLILLAGSAGVWRARCGTTDYIICTPTKVQIQQKVEFNNQTIFTTSPAAGAAGALPATPAGYLQVTINGTLQKIPYY